MKHAGHETLDVLEELLEKIRALPQLTERKRGTFYKKSVAFLHFHEDAAGIFADIKSDGEFKRFEANSAKQHELIIAFAKNALGVEAKSKIMKQMKR
jgi:hypothetical protein